MLIFTNRLLTDDDTAFGRGFTPGATRLALADVKRSGNGWVLDNPIKDVEDLPALDLLMQLLTGARPLLLYVHGNNNTPEDCFQRVEALGNLYTGCEVIGFSWPSEGYQSDGTDLPSLTTTQAGGGEQQLMAVTSATRTTGGIQDMIRRYHQAQTNAKDSVDAFARMLLLLGTARLHTNAQPFSLAIHSLGAHLFQYSLQVPGATESAGTAHNIALLAPCVRAAAHTEWITRFRPRGRTYVTYNKGDNVLFGAYVADGEQIKLGTEPGPDIVHGDGVRYISFTDAPNDFGGHGYFVHSVTSKAKKLFGRIFASQPDFAVTETPKAVYPFGCEPDGSVCYMAVPLAGNDGPS